MKLRHVREDIDEIQPQFKQLSLNSPRTRRTIKPKPLIKTVKFIVEAVCKCTSTETEILNLSCEPFYEHPPLSTVTSTHDLDSSGHLADISKSGSSNSSPLCFIPSNTSHLGRMSEISSSSSSPIPSSAAKLISQYRQKNTLKIEKMENSKIEQLINKWKNSNLVFGILEYIDKLICESGDVNTQIDDKSLVGTETLKETILSFQSTSRKRHSNADSTGLDIKKRLRSTSPMLLYEELLGTEVFAKWQDKKYYFAHITDIFDENHIQVVFLDSKTSTVTKEQIVSDLESLIGYKVMVCVDLENNKYYPGIVTSFFVDEGTFKYCVATDNGDFETGVADMFFTEHQAKLMKKGTLAGLHAASDIPLASDNQASCSGIQKEIPLERFSEDTDTSLTSKSSETIDTAVVMGCEVETYNPQNLTSTIKLKNVQGKAPKRGNKQEDLLLGPLNIKGSWFKGYQFLITCSTRELANTSEDVQTDNEDYPFTKIPFVFDRLLQQIKLGGGEVLEKFEEVHPTKYSTTYLITNRPCLTTKFLKCLGSGITMVCHEWVVNCTIKQKLLPLIELPAGWSLENKCFINVFDRKSTQPLSGLRIKLAQHSDKNFYKFWSNIINVVGGCASLFTGEFDNTNVIVAENGLKNSILEEALLYGMPIVSATWIIQSVIHGEIRSFDGHFSYNHLHEESDEF